MAMYTREKRWKTVFNNKTCFFVEPFVVDSILSNASSEALAGASARAGYDKSHDTMADRGGMASFLLRASNKIVRDYRGHVPASIFQELHCAVRARVFEAIHRYRPGTRVEGRFVPWGFEAYLHNFPLKRAWSDFHQEMRQSSGVRLDQPIHEDGTQTVLDVLGADAECLLPELDIDVIGGAFEQALVSSLKNSPGRKEYLLYNERGMTIEDIAAHLEDNVSACYRRLCQAAQGVVDTLQERIALILGTDPTTARGEILGYLSGDDPRYRVKLDTAMSAAYHSLIDGDGYTENVD